MENKSRRPYEGPTHRCILCNGHNRGYCPLCRTSEYCRTNEWVKGFEKKEGRR